MKAFYYFIISLVSVILFVAVIAIFVLILIHIPVGDRVLRFIVLTIGLSLLYTIGWYIRDIQNSFYSIPTAKALWRYSFSENRILPSVILGFITAVVVSIYLLVKGQL